MADQTVKVIFGNLFQGTVHEYNVPISYQNENISSTSSAESVDEFSADWDFWERHKALQEKALRRRRAARKYRRMARRMLDERRDQARELAHMIAETDDLKRQLEELRGRFHTLVYGKLDTERRYYNAQAALDEIRGVQKRKIWKSLPVAPEVDDESACVVCLGAPRTIAYVPCGHVACCEACAEALADNAAARDEDFLCPICREYCVKAQRLYFA